MSSEGKPRALKHLERRVRDDTYFVGGALAEYQEQLMLSDAELAKRLLCKPSALARLSLCRAPVAHAASFRSDVIRVAEFAGCGREQLARLLLEVQAVRALRGPHASAGHGSMLRAARDRRRSGMHQQGRGAASQPDASEGTQE